MGKGANRGRLVVGGLCLDSKAYIRNLFDRNDEMARSSDKTALGTAETSEALRNPPAASREHRLMLSSELFQISWGECRI